jgi:hypothetical protein
MALRPVSTSVWRERKDVFMHSIAMAPHTGVRLAETGFLLILFAGIWFAAAQVPALKFGTARSIIAGIALAVAGLLLIIATHWGHFH